MDNPKLEEKLNALQSILNEISAMGTEEQSYVNETLKSWAGVKKSAEEEEEEKKKKEEEEKKKEEEAQKARKEITPGPASAGVTGNSPASETFEKQPKENEVAIQEIAKKTLQIVQVIKTIQEKQDILAKEIFKRQEVVEKAMVNILRSFNVEKELETLQAKKEEEAKNAANIVHKNSDSAPIMNELNSIKELLQASNNQVNKDQYSDFSMRKVEVPTNVIAKMITGRG